MELDLSGKNVMVIGGGSNIGKAIVHAFAAEGCDLTIAELSVQHGELVARRSRPKGRAEGLK